MRGRALIVAMIGCTSAPSVPDGALPPNDGRVDAAVDASVDAVADASPDAPPLHYGPHYIKASNTDEMDDFGASLAVSGDGNTFAVGATGESSGATGINGDQTANNYGNAGAVYVFVRSGDTWVQQAYVKSSFTDALDRFGTSIALSADGNTLAIGAPFEDSAATTINGEDADNSASDSGAVYVFRRTGTSWAQEAYVKASNAEADDLFGGSLGLSSDGNTLAVGASWEDNYRGAAYVFTRSGSTWTQEDYVKPPVGDIGDYFGGYLSLAGDGNTLVVGAPAEDSTATGIGGDATNNAAEDSGAAHVFVRIGTTWQHQAYLKASNTEVGDWFGFPVTITGDGNTVAVSAIYEDGAATGIDGDGGDNSAMDAGAVYIFERTGGSWAQAAYVKATNTEARDAFSWDVGLSTDGGTLLVGACSESGSGSGYAGNPSSNTKPASGAVFRYLRVAGTWTYDAYIKALNNGTGDCFGQHVALSTNGALFAATGRSEASSATGVDGDMTNNSLYNAGAVYTYE